MESKNTTTKPVTAKERLIVRIEKEGHEGDGIVRKDNFIIIVKKANLGYTYEIEITEVYATYAFAKVIRRIQVKSVINEEEYEEEEKLKVHEKTKLEERK